MPTPPATTGLAAFALALHAIQLEIELKAAGKTCFTLRTSPENFDLRHEIKTTKISYISAALIFTWSKGQVNDTMGYIGLQTRTVFLVEIRTLAVK